MNSIIDGVDYGPLALLFGRWTGINGRNSAPDAAGNTKVSSYTDELSFELAGGVHNAGEQYLVALEYRHIASSPEGNVIHRQTGHWLYEAEAGLVMHSLSVPRGVCLLAGGNFFESDGELSFVVEAKQGDPTFGIVQSPFMVNKARTLRFEMALNLTGNTLEYSQATTIELAGRQFKHTDSSVLQRLSGLTPYS